MTAYLNSAITDDWAAMDGGKSSPATTDALDALYAAALAYRASDSHGEAVMAEILHQLNTITEARRARLVKASGIVPGVIWLVLFGGAVLTIGFTFFFGTVNLRAQAVMTGALAMLIFSGLLVIAVYGPDNHMRLTGKHETAAIHEFSYGVADRGASIRVPHSFVKNDYRGYLEDRRPNSQGDPYQIASQILKTIESVSIGKISAAA